MSRYQRAIATRLLRFGEKLRYAPPETETAASRLVNNNNNAWLFGVIFDQGIRAENAWNAPYLLKRRLGHLNIRRIAVMPISELRRAINGTGAQTALHRYTNSMPRWLKAAAKKIVNEYRGNAENVWADCHTAAEVIARLDEFKGIGLKKAHMAAAMLRDWYDFGGFDAINMAVDVGRCARATGLETTRTHQEWRPARDLHGRGCHAPKNPGALDVPTWMVGRQWCHATGPDCKGVGEGKPCPVGRYCGHRRVIK